MTKNKASPGLLMIPYFIKEDKCAAFIKTGTTLTPARFASAQQLVWFGEYEGNEAITLIGLPQVEGSRFVPMPAERFADLLKANGYNVPSLKDIFEMGKAPTVQKALPRPNPILKPL